MADKLRVHTLGKELGVDSKAILAKCKLEGVEGVTNHMSTLSAGLAETIRQWFSEGTVATAVEEADKVDLEKVRARRRPRKKKDAEHADHESGVDVMVEEEAEGTADVEAPELVEPQEEAPPAAEQTELHKEEEAVAKPGARKPLPADPAPTIGPVLVEAAESDEPQLTEPPAAAPGVVLAPAAQVVAPHAKEQVKPAGPQNVPTPAQMKGPKVIGFAKPDPIVRPAPRPPQRGPQLPDAPDAAGRTAAKRGGRGKSAEREAEELKKSKARFNPRRTGDSLLEVSERLQEWNERDLIERQERLQSASGRGIHARRARERAAMPQQPGKVAPRKTQAQVTEPIVVHELCAATGIGMAQMFNKFRDHNVMVTRNAVVPTDIAEMVMLEFGVELQVVKPKTALEKLQEAYAALPREHIEPRPPVVAMLGHVDHGKTSLLDAIRQTSVASGEAGGITQHIGAYRVQHGDLSVTFLDTPGHEAFTAMRARGANLTDVVVLLVAADDGVMPQTVEAINHAKAAETHIVIALNKIDLPGIDLNKIYGQLSEHQLTPSEWGGETDVIKTSATTGQGVEELVTHLATLSDLLDLKADPTLPPSATVIDASMRTGMGPLATVLVREGTLRTGDMIVCGPGSGRVRFLKDDRGRQIKEAPPGVPVEVGGLDEVPNAGDTLFVVKSLQEAKAIAEETKQYRRQEAMLKMQRKPTTLADLLQRQSEDAVPELNLILKADVQGSIDALMKTLSEIPTSEVKLNFLHTGNGSVTEGDVVLAEASGAMVAGFNVIAEPGAQRMADTEGVDIKLYRVIYNMVDDIRGALEGLLPTIKTEESRGKAEVREVFHVSKSGVVAGCMVISGVIGRTNNARVIRDGHIILPSTDDVKRGRHRAIASLRRFKDDAKEVRDGMECGIRIENFDDLKPGDIIEAYEVIETRQKL